LIEIGVVLHKNRYKYFPPKSLEKRPLKVVIAALIRKKGKKLVKRFVKPHFGLVLTYGTSADWPAVARMNVFRTKFAAPRL
jgi:hypothetical protein